MIKVTLRKKPISKGRHSLYLDFYPAIRIPNSNKSTRREFLKMYVVDKPKTEIEKELNREILQKADIIRAERMKSILNEKLGFLDKEKRNANFLSYFHNKASAKDQKWLKVYEHFNRFTEGNCSFKLLTIELCNEFKNYLLDTEQLNNENLKLSQNTASSYYTTFRAVLKLAFRERYLEENINEFIDPIPTLKTHIEYLNLQEFRQLAKTPCEVPVLKQASLFACLTGLRISDILKLDWSEIIETSKKEYSMKNITQKTQTVATLPLSTDAYNLLGERQEGKIFKGLKRSMVQYPLKKWIEQSKINKKITFHCLRHSFATILVELGVEIYLIKELLTHNNINNTLIYATAENHVMREAVNKITIIQNENKY